MPASQGVLTWAMGVGFVASFVLTGWHAHFALHLGPGYTLVAMMAFVGAVLAGLLLNLWFMAGQRYVLEFLAWYEPTSGIAEWVHDTVFGVPQDRIDAAYRAGSHRGRRTKDGKSYVQLIIPRRRTPHPCSLGGLLHVCFFSARDPFDSDQCISQILRSLTILSLLVLLAESTLLEWIFHSDAMFADARQQLKSGQAEAAVTTYLHLLKKDPHYSPPVLAVHQTHLALQHPWAAAAYLVAATFQLDKKYVEARHWYRRVLEQAPECQLARHSLRAVSHWAMPKANPESQAVGEKGRGLAVLEHVRMEEEEEEGGEEMTWALEPSVGYIVGAFDAYAYSYDASMQALGYRASDMLVSALTALLDSDLPKNIGTPPQPRGSLWDLGCGTGLFAQALEAAQRAGTWPPHNAPAHRTCVDVSEGMLAKARAKHGYDEYVQGHVVEVLQRHARESGGEGGLDMVIGCDVAPYFGSLDELLRAVLGVLKTGGRFAFTVEALEPHLPLPDPLQALQLASAREGRGGGEGGGERHAGRGWELMPNGRVAHLRWHVEKAALSMGYEIEAVGYGPIRWQAAHAVEGHVFVLTKL